MGRKVRTIKYGKTRVNKRKHRRSLKKKMKKRTTKKARQYRKNITRRRLGGNYNTLTEFNETAPVGMLFHDNTGPGQLSRISYIKLNDKTTLKYYDADLSAEEPYVLISDNEAVNGTFDANDFVNDYMTLMGTLMSLTSEHRIEILNQIFPDDDRESRIDAVMEAYAAKTAAAGAEKTRKFHEMSDGTPKKSNKKSRQSDRRTTIEKMEPQVHEPQVHEYWNDDANFNPQEALTKHGVGDSIIIHHNNQMKKDNLLVTKKGITHNGELIYPRKV